MGSPARRIGTRAGLIVFAAVCCATLVAGPASSRPAVSPVARIDVSFDGVIGKRPPNIVETRIVGKAQLFYEESPQADGGPAHADKATGAIVVAYDVLTPHPQTFRVGVKVTGGKFQDLPGSQTLVTLEVEVVKALDGDNDQIAGCKPGSKGKLYLAKNLTNSGYNLSLPPCQLSVRQQGKIARNSRVHVTISPKCLRTSAARKPLCAGSGEKKCRLAGSWSQTTTGVGSTSWAITADGKAQESGIGNATGTATLTGNVLTIVWKTTNGYAGVYRWTLRPDCTGTGTLTFTQVGAGDPRGGQSFASTVRGSPPS